MRSISCIAIVRLCKNEAALVRAKSVAFSYFPDGSFLASRGAIKGFCFIKPVASCVSCASMMSIRSGLKQGRFQLSIV